MPTTTPEVDDLTAINRAMKGISRLEKALSDVPMPYSTAMVISRLFYETRCEMMGERVERKKFRALPEPE